MNKPDESLRDAVSFAFQGETSELAAEIARLIREGTAESRKKAQNLFQERIGGQQNPSTVKTGGA